PRGTRKRLGAEIPEEAEDEREADDERDLRVAADHLAPPPAPESRLAPVLPDVAPHAPHLPGSSRAKPPSALELPARAEVALDRLGAISDVSEQRTEGESACRAQRRRGWSSRRRRASPTPPPRCRRRRAS